MKIHTTNYFNTFISVAEDCAAERGETPSDKAEKKTIARRQYEILAEHPYAFTSDDIFFQVYAERNELTEQELPAARQQFFSKGQPCFRSSPLTKTYGWGVHSDEQGRVAIYGMETEEYERFMNDPKVEKVRAMRSKRK